jgi:hypothetical protein
MMLHAGAGKQFFVRRTKQCRSRGLGRLFESHPVGHVEGEVQQDSIFGFLSIRTAMADCKSNSDGIGAHQFYSSYVAYVEFGSVSEIHNIPNELHGTGLRISAAATRAGDHTKSSLSLTANTSPQVSHSVAFASQRTLTDTRLSSCARPQRQPQARTAQAVYGPPSGEAVCATLSSHTHLIGRIATAAANTIRKVMFPSNSIFVSLRCVGGLSWVRVYKSRHSALSKAPVQSDGLPTIWPVTYFLKSPEHFGRQKQRSMSLRVRRARCARLNAISLATVNGRAMRSLPSSRKSSNVIQCGM